VFGPRQDPKSPYSGVISIFCDRLRAGRDIAIFGDGLQVRDFIYVADVVAALVAAMQRLPGGSPIFNVCTGRATAIGDLARIIAELCGRAPEIAFHPARVGEIRVSLGDPALAAQSLGVVAATELRTGLERTIASA